MSSLRHIRKSVLKETQAGIATIAHVSQGTVSKWEKGELHPNRDEMSRIREAATDRGLPWDDAWFFEEPAEGVQ